MSEAPLIRGALVRQADAVATLIAIMSGIYGVLLGVLYEPFGSIERFTFESARWSAWLNIAAAVTAIAFMTAHRVARNAAERRGGDAQLAFERVILVSLSISMIIAVGHTYIGGSQNTILPVSGVVLAALATWFVRWRYVMVLAAVWLTGYLVVVALEATGVVPYAPIFRGGEALATIFLDWRSLMGTMTLVGMLFGGMMVLLRYFHAPLHAARAAVEDEVESRTEALRVAHESLDRQLHHLESSPAEQRVKSAEKRTARARVEHRLALRAAALRTDHLTDRIDDRLKAVRDRARATRRAIDAGLGGQGIARNALGDLQSALDDAAGAVLELRGRPAPPIAESQMVSLDTLARDVTALVRAEAAAGEVRTQLELGRTPAVPVDRGALEEALFAVMSNALRAVADQRSKRIILRTRVDARTVVLDVHDTGDGLPAEDVFEAGVGRWGRPGLGLAVARAILVAHNGTVTGGASPHGGAVIRLSLPRPPPTTGSLPVLDR